jgi:hypothetical protein
MSMNSGWIYAACYRHSNTKSPELATLFARCCHLLRLPIYPVFIFDGQERPNKKRGKRVQGNHHWITTAMKEMLDHLGFPWVDVRPLHYHVLYLAHSLAGTWRG